MIRVCACSIVKPPQLSIRLRAYINAAGSALDRILMVL
jgi:hypothetical protein